MPGNFHCANPACANKDRGRHLTARTAYECRDTMLDARATVPGAAPTLSRRRTLAALAVAYGEGVISDEDVLGMPEFADIGDEVSEILLDLIASGPGSAARESATANPAEYAEDAYTGYDDLSEWAEAAMEVDPRAPVGESAENYAAFALLTEIWTLPSRDGSGRYRVMKRLGETGGA